MSRRRPTRGAVRAIWTLDPIRWKLLYLGFRERDRVGALIDGLAKTPLPPGAMRVPGTRRLYRVSSGEIRILYVVEEARILIVAVEQGPRSLPERFRRLRGREGGDDESAD